MFSEVLYSRGGLRIIIFDNDYFFVQGLHFLLKSILSEYGVSPVLSKENKLPEGNWDWVIVSESKKQPHCPPDFIISHVQKNEPFLFTYIREHKSSYVYGIDENNCSVIYRTDTVARIHREFQQCLKKLLFPPASLSFFQTNLFSLSCSERKVFSLIYKNFNVDKIARVMHISTKTVYIHHRNIVSKLCFKNRIHFYAWLTTCERRYIHCHIINLMPEKRYAAFQSFS